MGVRCGGIITSWALMTRRWVLSAVRQLTAWYDSNILLRFHFSSHIKKLS